jgi:hypothetical protein
MYSCSYGIRNFVLLSLVLEICRGLRHNKVIVIVRATIRPHFSGHVLTLKA